jgi:RNA polymerase sigma-70 factor (ECF subfamily)
LSDEELIAAARSGDDDAFKRLVQLYEPVVARTVTGMLGNCPEAEDVGQDTFIRFYRSLGKFRGESSLRTYLTRIAINLSLNELKRRKRRRHLFSDKPVEDYHDLADHKPREHDTIDHELIAQALQEIEPKFRSVIVLRLIDGYSTEETARILGIPLGTVLSRLARAQKKMRIILSPHLGVTP